MKYIYSIVFVLFVGLTAMAQNVTITGKSANADGKTIWLKTYADKISMLETTLDEAVIGNREFKLKTSINYPTLVYLQIENYSYEFIIEPNRNYEVAIPFFDWTIDEQVNPHLQAVPLVVEVNNLPANDLNNLVLEFNNYYEYILANYGKQMLLRGEKKYVDSLRSYAKDLITQSPQNTYFEMYTQYKIAEIEYAANFKSKKKLAETFFVNQPILYNHIGYMDFFNIYFNKYFTNGTKHIPLEKMILWVNENQYFYLLDSLGLDPILKNEVLRELVFLKGMNEAFLMHDYNGQAIMSLLETFINETRFDEHKKIARNIIDKHKTVPVAEDIFKIKLIDADKKAFTLDEFKGKWLYLSFVRVKEAPSIIELESMAFYKDSLYKKYNIEFITIDCDREFLKMYHLLKNSKSGERYNWKWLHFNGNYKLLDYFDVKTYPTFAIINPKGEIYRLLAPSPGEGVFVNPEFLKGPTKKPEEENNLLPLRR